MEKKPTPEEILKFTRDKYLREIRACEPFFTLFEVTNACDLNCKIPMLDCKYCGLEKGLGEYELTTQEVCSILTNITRSGTRSVSFIGGEPTRREDLPQIVAHAARSAEVAIVSNGMLLDRDYIRRLRNSGISWIKVYLDSPDADVHDSVRGKGTHRAAMAALELCKQAGINISIITTITQLNYKMLRQMIRIAIELRAVIEVTEFLPYANAGNQLLLSKEQRREMQEHLIEGQRLLGRDTIHFGHYYVAGQDEEGIRVWADPSKKGSNVGYPWGIYGYGIKSNGKMVADPLITIGLGDLLTQSLKDIWDNSLTLKELRYRGRLKGKCGGCEYMFICGGHRGRTYVVTGDFMKEDPACWYDPILS